MPVSPDSGQATTALALVPSLLRLATPLALIQLAQVAVSTTDLMMLGHHGASSLAAGALGFAIFNFFRTQGFGLLVGVSNLVAEDISQSRTVLRAASHIALVAAVIAGAMLVVLSGVTGTFAPEGDVAAGVTAYLLGIAPGYVPLFLFYACRGILVGQGKADGLLIITLSVVGLNALLDYGLLYGRLGMPQLGVFGVALSSSLCFLFQLMASFWLIRDMRVSDDEQPARTGLTGAIISLGLPTAGSYAVEASFAVGLTMIAARISAGALAAHAVAEQVMYVAFMLSVGLSHATSVLVSRAQGSKIGRRQAAMAGWGTGLCIAVLCGAVYLAFPDILAEAFLKPGATITVVIAILPLVALVQPFDFLQNISVGALRAIRRAGAGLWINMAGYWLIGLPVAWVLAFPCGLGLQGIWTGYAVGTASVALTMMALFFRATR